MNLPKSFKVLFIVGTKNQTTMMHQIAKELPNHYDCYFSNFYGDGWLKAFTDLGWAEITVLGNHMQKQNVKYFETHNLKNDYRALKNNYDLVFTTNDTTIPKNLKGKKMILVQDGILEPVDWRFNTSKRLGLPRVLADTAMLGLSDAYEYFCVFSEGYKREFIKRGVKEEKILVTSAPNFDNLDQFKNNTFPHKDYVLAITSNHRETKRKEDRIGLIRKVKRIANGKQIIFKLHPREQFDRAIKEIKIHAPESLIFTDGVTDEMVANCAKVVSTYSTVVLEAAAMGKEVYCDYSQKQLDDLKPVQNGGTSARTIANLGVGLLESKDEKVSVL